jgi:hypothetical protein
MTAPTANSLQFAYKLNVAADSIPKRPLIDCMNILLAKRQQIGKPLLVRS